MTHVALRTLRSPVADRRNPFDALKRSLSATPDKISSRPEGAMDTYAQRSKVREGGRAGSQAELTYDSINARSFEKHQTAVRFLFYGKACGSGERDRTVTLPSRYAPT